MPRKASSTRQKALKIADIALAKQARDVAILDVRKVSSICDYFVICSGESQRQVKAIHEEVIKSCKKNEIRIQHSEKDEAARWILVDFFDVILHIFFEEARSFYNLEYLWNI